MDMTSRFAASSWSQPSNLLSFRLHRADTPFLPGDFCKGGLHKNGFLRLRQQRRFVKVVLHAGMDSEFSPSPGDDKPYVRRRGRRVAYLDEQDVVSFVDLFKRLVPIDPGSFNPASYLWKKIGDIPDHRRHRLLVLMLLETRRIENIWQLSGSRFQDDNLMEKCASTLLSQENNQIEPEFWDCRISTGPLPFPWSYNFRMVIFRGIDGGRYGRIICGAAYLSALANSYCPLYFTVKDVKEVMSTGQPCDLAYEFGDGHLYLPSYPDGFPKPVKHPWPFNDHLVIYIRHVGPGVLAGQAWLEGRKLDQVPKKFCGEILMVKDYFP